MPGTRRVGRVQVPEYHLLFCLAFLKNSLTCFSTQKMRFLRLADSRIELLYTTLWRLAWRVSRELCLVLLVITLYSDGRRNKRLYTTVNQFICPEEWYTHARGIETMNPEAVMVGSSSVASHCLDAYREFPIDSSAVRYSRYNIHTFQNA